MPRLSPKITAALNEQINVELSSAYTYLAMSAYCQEANLPGAAGWLRLQWQEELGHATKLIDYMAERGASTTLKAIGKPAAEFKSLLHVFQEVLKHEETVTASIYRICDLATAEKDYAAQALLQWYVNEQVEEENSAAEVVRMLELAGESGPGLMMVDGRLGARARG